MAALFHLAAILVGMLAVPVCHTYPAITYKASPAFQTYGLGLMPIFNYAKVYVVLTNFILRIKISIIFHQLNDSLFGKPILCRLYCDIKL